MCLFGVYKLKIILIDNFCSQKCYLWYILSVWIYGIEKLCRFLFIFFLFSEHKTKFEISCDNRIWCSHKFGMHFNFEIESSSWMPNNVFNVQFSVIFIMICNIFMWKSAEDSRNSILFKKKKMAHKIEVTNSNFVKIQKWKIAMRWLAAYIWWV